MQNLRPTIERGRPKIGLAFSGGTLRAIAQLGILEVFDEHRIPIDYIAAAASGCITAAAYACGTLQKLKETWFSLDNDKLKSLVGREGANGGIYHLRKMEDFLRQFTENKHFEDVKPRLAFVAVDIVAGEEVAIQMGDIARAARISCSVPGIFEPVKWGGRLLVDGGLLLDTVPVSFVREMGGDIIIGVDIADSKYVFGNYGWLIYFWKKYIYLRQNSISKFLSSANRYLKSHLQKILPDFGSEVENYAVDLDEKKRSTFSVLSRSLDVMIEKKYRHEISESKSEVLLLPPIKHLRSYDTKNVAACYEEGRRAAEAAMPRIKRLIENYGI